MKQKKIAINVVKYGAQVSVVSARTIYYPVQVGVVLATISSASTPQNVGSAVAVALDTIESAVRNEKVLTDVLEKPEILDRSAMHNIAVAEVTVFRVIGDQQPEYIVSAHEPGSPEMASFVSRVVLENPNPDEIGNAVIQALRLASIG